MPALAPVDKPEWEEEDCVDVGVVRRLWVEVGEGVALGVVVEEVVGLGGGEVSNLLRRLWMC